MSELSSNRVDQLMRVGIVLPSDRRNQVVLAGHDENGLVATTNRWSGPVEVCADGNIVVVKQNGSVNCKQDVLRIRSSAYQANQAITVLNCPIGRGFHWSKCIDVQLGATVEVSAINGFLFVVNQLPVETYLQGVITAEMSEQCPLAFMKAHAVVARSWTLAAVERKHADLGIDLCNDDCCQRFQGLAWVTDSARRAVEQTCGQVLVDEHSGVVDANYAKCCGGITEAPEHVWGVAKPGISSIVDAPAGTSIFRLTPADDRRMDEFLCGEDTGQREAYCSPQIVPAEALPRYLGRVDDGGSHFRWKVRYLNDQLTEIVRKKLAIAGAEMSVDDMIRILELRVIKRGVSGRATELEIAYHGRSGHRQVVTIDGQHRIRDVLSESFLYSSAFVVKAMGGDRDRPEALELIGAGWGHGVGMCQIGALGMALQGRCCEEILAHYFPTARLTTVSD